MYFVGGGEYANGPFKGRTISWNPLFKISKDISDKEKGESVLRILDEFVTRVDCEKSRGSIGRMLDKGLMELSGVGNAASFYRNARRCDFTLGKGDKVIRFQPYKRESGGTYSGDPDDVIQAPADDPEALGRALDECLDKAI